MNGPALKELNLEPRIALTARNAGARVARAVRAGFETEEGVI